MFNFPNGYPGAVSRSKDDVIVSLKNAGGTNLAFGIPVFKVNGERSCRPYSDGMAAEEFIGFTVRIAAKTPDTYGSKTAFYGPNEAIDVLTRGSIVLEFANTAHPGSNVYLRKADGQLVSSPGAEGSTIQLPNCTVRSSRDTAHCAEVVLTKRNIF